MKRLVNLTLCLLALRIAPPAQAADAIAAEPVSVLPGQKVTLRWYFTGDKVLVTGGRFGKKGQVVTGRTVLTDTPRKTTRYTFDVWYRVAAAGKPARKVHAQYSLVVPVTTDALSGMASYRSTRGWQVCYPLGWRHDHVNTSDEGKDGLVFFQKEDDCVERLAVAVMAAKEMTCDDLMKQVCADMPSHYENLQLEAPTEIAFHAIPACRTYFTGSDMTHPGTRTRSAVLVFVHDGRGFVISARTSANDFKARQAVLEKMINSFALTEKTASAKP